MHIQINNIKNNINAEFSIDNSSDPEYLESDITFLEIFMNRDVPNRPPITDRNDKTKICPVDVIKSITFSILKFKINKNIISTVKPSFSSISILIKSITNEYNKQ